MKKPMKFFVTAVVVGMLAAMPMTAYANYYDEAYTELMDEIDNKWPAFIAEAEANIADAEARLAELEAKADDYGDNTELFEHDKKEIRSEISKYETDKETAEKELKSAKAQVKDIMIGLKQQADEQLSSDVIYGTSENSNYSGINYTQVDTKYDDDEDMISDEELDENNLSGKQEGVDNEYDYTVIETTNRYWIADGTLYGVSAWYWAQMERWEPNAFVTDTTVLSLYDTDGTLLAYTLPRATDKDYTDDNYIIKAWDLKNGDTYYSYTDYGPGVTATEEVTADMLTDSTYVLSVNGVKYYIPNNNY